MTQAERNAQTTKNLSYVIGMYSGTIKILLDQIENPGTPSYREAVTRLANKTLKRGEAIFSVHGEKTYEQVMEEMELLLQMP